MVNKDRKIKQLDIVFEKCKTCTLMPDMIYKKKKKRVIIPIMDMKRYLFICICVMLESNKR